MGSAQNLQNVAIIPLILGFGLLLTGGVLMLSALRPDMDAVAPGVITGFDQGQTSGGRARCGLVATFTVDRRSYVARSIDSSRSNCKREIGESVQVKYSSANPARSQIDAGYVPWLAGALAVVGFVLLVFGVGLWVRLGRRGRPHH